MGSWKYCKFCGEENGNNVTSCKNCSNDRFWTRPNIRSLSLAQEFKMKNGSWEQ